MGAAFVAATVGLSASVSISVPEGISSHVHDQIRWSVSSAQVAALVTVQEAGPKASSVPMRVDEVVMGSLAKGAVIQVSPKSFINQDLSPGKVLLVFLNASGGKYVSNGRYELAIDGKIREVPVASFLTAARAEASTKAFKAQAKRARAAAPSTEAPKS